MKWLLAFVLIGVTVAAGFAIKTRPKAQRVVLFLIPFITFYGSTTLGFSADFTYYRGDTRGIAITLIDLCALALLVALPRTENPPPYRFARGLYLFLCLFSIVLAETPIFSYYGTFQVVRMYVVLLAVARACENPRMPPVVLSGLASGLIYAALVALHQRYILHEHQVYSTFSHENTLGMVVDLVAPLMFALVLAGEGGRLAPTALIAGSFCIILALSRGAIIMFPSALLIVLVGSFARRFTARKLKIAAIGIVGALALALKALSTIIQRFETAPEASMQARERFVSAARLMLSDHPLGIGLNQFSHVLGETYAKRIGLVGVDVDGIVHNIYWLTLAELGYLGFFAYLLLIGHPLLWSFRGARLARNDVRGDVLLGCFAAFTVTYLHGTLEWILRQADPSYVLYILSGLVAGLYRQLTRPGMRQV